MSVFVSVFVALVAAVSISVFVSAFVYGRKSADRTEHGNDVIFLVFLATVFGNLEVWRVRK